VKEVVAVLENLRSIYLLFSELTRLKLSMTLIKLQWHEGVGEAEVQVHAL